MVDALTASNKLTDKHVSGATPRPYDAKFWDSSPSGHRRRKQNPVVDAKAHWHFASATQKVIDQSLFSVDMPDWLL